jgi:hypothetical protein
MKFSVEKEITLYPAVGEETSRPPVTVSGIGWLYYRLGNGLFVWRTPDQQNEVGRRGTLGGTFYARVGDHILEASFVSLHDAMRAVSRTLKEYVDGTRAG